MSAQAQPNYGRRSIILILALGAVSVIAALAGGEAGTFLNFSVTQLLVLGIILLAGGVLLLAGVGAGISPVTISNIIIGLGVAAIIVALVLRLGNLASDLLSFDLQQLLWLGVVFVIVGFLVRNWVSSGLKIHVPRRIAWTLIVLGIICAVAGLIAGMEGSLLTFNGLHLLVVGILFAVVGVLLLLLYSGELDEPQPVPPPMAQARAGTIPAPRASVPPPPPAAPKIATGELKAAAPPVPAPEIRSAVPSMAKKDDLTIIEGIGPKSAEALYKARIFTFSQLAELSPDDIERIVKHEGGVNLVNDTRTWPKQARLLAEGKRQEFEEYIRHLVNSRDPDDKKK